MSFKKHFLNLFLAILALGMSAHAKVEYDVRFNQEPVAGAHTSVMMEIYLKGNGEKVNSIGASVTLPEGFSGDSAGFVKGSLFNDEYGAGSNSGLYDPESRTWLITLANDFQFMNKVQFIAPAEWTLLCKFPVTFDKGVEQPEATVKLDFDVFGMSVINENNNKVDFFDFQVPAEVNLAIIDGFIMAGEPLTQNGTEDFSDVHGYDPLIQGRNYAFSGSKVWDKETNAWKEIGGLDILITDLVETDIDGVPVSSEEDKIFRIVNKGVDNIELYSIPNAYGQSYLKFSVVSKAYPKATPKTFIMSYVVDPADDPAEITATVGPGTEGQPYSIIVNITDIDSDPLDYLDQGGAYAFYIRINGRDFETKRFEKVLPLTLELAEPLPFDLIANENGQRTATKDMTVQYVSKRLVAPGKGDEIVSPEQTVTFTDVDQPVVELNAPTVTISAGPYTTDNAIVIDDFSKADFSDADGDEIKLHYYWTKGGEEAAGATIPSTAKKGETWTPHVRVFTKPYGEDVIFKTYDGDPITIVDSPAVKVSSVDSLFIQKGEATTGSWTITFSDADIADGETYSKETIPVPVAKNGDVTVDKLTFNSDYTYTVTYTYKVGDPSKEFTEPDAFDITIKNEGGAGFTVPFSVNYMEDPAPVIAVTTEPVLSIAEGDDAVITAEISAADSNTAVAPTGVQSIVWTMTLNEGTSNGALIALDAKAEGFVATEGVTPASSKVTVKVPFNVLSGRDRSATATYTLTATAKDKNAASSKSWVITVHDTDQAPVITEAILANSVDADAIFTGTDVTVTASGATDPDGDAIAYYTFNGDKADESHSIKATNLVKGDVLDFEVVAYSKPAYSSTEGVLNSETKAFAKQITVLNSAPTANAEAKTVETSEVADDTTEVVFELVNMAEFKDIDMITVGDKLRDSLTYSVSAPSVAAAGTLAVDAATGAVTYKPAKFYNGSFSFELTATDESQTSATATVNVTVKAVNDAPFIVGRDIYHVPSDCDGTTQTATFTVNMGGGEDEKTQTIATAAIIEVLNGLDLDLTTEAAVTINNDVEPRTISFQYTLTPDTAEKLGKETIVKLQVTDATTDGTEAKESAVFEMKIVLGASPWYPTVEAKDFTPADALVADGSKAYMVEIKNATTLFDTIKIAGNDIMAADYLDYTDGLLPGEYTYNVYEWNPSTGKGTDVVATATVVVDEFDVAAKPTLTVTPKSANSSELKISAPMASMYCLDITTPSNETITSWGRFMADAEGIIRSEVTLTKSFSEVGDYKVKVAGWNPKMAPMTTGEYSDVVTVTIAGEDVADPTFPAITDAAYRPVDNKAILIANSKQAVVDFAWPSISTKAEYTLYVYTANGKLVGDKAIATGTNAIATVTLDASQPVNHYMWRVSAQVNGKTVWSNSLAFKLVTSTDAPLVNSVTRQAGATDDLTLDIEEFSEVDHVTYDVMAYDVSAGTWTKMVNVPFEKLEVGKGVLRLPAGTLSGLEDGDYVYLRVRVNGKAVSASFEDFALRAL